MSLSDRMPKERDGAKGDLTCRQMARIFKHREDHYPVSARYIREVHDSPDKTGDTEREHMEAWFRLNSTTGAGAYSRRKGNSSARTCYNRLANAASLLWIAEAVGVDAETVERAYDAAVEAGDHRRACGAIRGIIPWETICPLASRLM